MSQSIQTKTVKADSNFKHVGLMIDLSRGKVLTVKKINEIIDNANKMGFTYINLYLEDLLTLEEYPQYGYLRGRYSDQEITEIVDYAHQCGLEIFPAIQTLGHLEHFLRWEASNPIKDTDKVIDVTAPQTYEFIDILIKKCKHLFKTNKINIGMDEAFDLGQGGVFRKGNKLSKKELYLNYLDIVVDICKKYEFDEIKIWSDMLFSTYANADGESLYDTNFKSKIEDLDPAIELIFWNYWTETQKTYEDILDAHHNFSSNVSMALGIHTWGIPYYNLNQLEVSKTALRACELKGVKDVLFTMWGDDGSLYNVDSIALGMYETMSYILGHEPSAQEFNQLTGFDYQEFSDVCRILSVGVNPLHVVWNDPITNLHLKMISSEELKSIVNKAKAMRVNSTNEVSQIYNLYLACICNDIEMYLATSCTEQMYKQAYQDLESLFKLIENTWIRDAKINGLEEIQLRFLNKLNRYTFYYEMQDHPDVVEIRNEKVEEIVWMKKMYSNISKATQFRW